jgi:hypothetical protein
MWEWCSQNIDSHTNPGGWDLSGVKGKDEVLGRSTLDLHYGVLSGWPEDVTVGLSQQNKLGQEDYQLSMRVTP